MKALKMMVSNLISLLGITLIAVVAAMFIDSCKPHCFTLKNEPKSQINNSVILTTKERPPLNALLVHSGLTDQEDGL